MDIRALLLAPTASIALLLPLAAARAATPVTVQASANIYAAGLGSPTEIGSDGSLPVALSIGDAAPSRIAFDGIVAGPPVDGASGGGVTCYWEGPASSGDGNVCAGTRTEVESANGYSAFRYEGRTMVLVGLFVGGTKSPLAPADFVSSDAEANATDTFAPLLQQVFAIGDGRTAAGALQQFVVPDGATTLYLGFADSYGFIGYPGYYGDNYGSLRVHTNLAPVPEPAPAAMLLTGLAALGARRLRRS